MQDNIIVEIAVFHYTGLTLNSMKTDGYKRTIDALIFRKFRSDKGFTTSNILS